MDHIKIRQNIIEASYKSIQHLLDILAEPILRSDYESDDLGPEKFLTAVKAKKQAQLDAFEMLANIETAQAYVESLTTTASKKQEKVNKNAKGFAEVRARD